MIELNDVKQALTNDPAIDIDYLINIISTCTLQDNYDELFSYCDQMLFSTIERDEQPLQEVKTKQTTTQYDDLMIKVKEMISNQQYKEAEVTLEPLIMKLNIITSIRTNNKERLYCFNNPIEYELYSKLFLHTNKVIPIKMPIAKLYYLRSYLAYSQSQTDLQIHYLKKSMLWNPMDLEVLNEYIQLCFNKPFNDTLLDHCVVMWRCAYTKEDLAQAYKNLANYYYLNRNYILALRLYRLSNSYEQNDLCEEYVSYIYKQKELGTISFDESLDTFKQGSLLAQKDGFDLMPNMQIKIILEDMIQDLNNLNLDEESNHIQAIIKELYNPTSL